MKINLQSSKLATIGGSSLKNNVINIFGELFSAELKTKMCWSGSTAGKIPFAQFKGIRNVIRLAVKRSFKCTQHLIDCECKLRFKQADKDYEREQFKNQKM